MPGCDQGTSAPLRTRSAWRAACSVSGAALGVCVVGREGGAAGPLLSLQVSSLEACDRGHWCPWGSALPPSCPCLSLGFLGRGVTACWPWCPCGSVSPWVGMCSCMCLCVCALYDLITVSVRVDGSLVPCHSVRASIALSVSTRVRGSVPKCACQTKGASASVWHLCVTHQCVCEHM